MNEITPPYAEQKKTKQSKVRIGHLLKMKEEGRKWAMLTSYDMYTAQLFEKAGIPVLLIGDSAANNVLGYETSLPVTVDELLPLVRAVARSTERPLIIADLPFGSYQASPEQCFHTSVRFMKEGLAHAVKLEGGIEMIPQVKKLSSSGIPVMVHIGFTPQSEHQLSGYKVQGKEGGGACLVELAEAFEEAGAFALLVEMVPAHVGASISNAVKIPVVGIGAGSQCDAQVLVWQDMAGLRTGKLPRFVKQYADLNSVLTSAVKSYIEEVENGTFPCTEHEFD